MDVTRGGHRGAPLILIVDNERDIADMLDSYFRLEGYRTLVAASASEALRAARCAPDVILLDVNLPDADGFSVCREMRELVACPIIFLTARVEDADNLVANATRYARSEVGVSLSWEDDELELVVSDDGPGFGEAALERAAEPFWGESKGAGGHLGLGLYVARLLAEKHGGSLELSRGEGGGALVRVRVSAPREPRGA